MFDTDWAVDGYSGFDEMLHQGPTGAIASTGAQFNWQCDDHSNCDDRLYAKEGFRPEGHGAHFFADRPDISKTGGRYTTGYLDDGSELR
jgi:hypothetical protein